VKKLGIATAFAVAAVAVATASALATTSTRIVPFTAKYAGTAVVNINDQVANISATGTGTGTLLGTGKITGTGKGDTTQQPCVPFNGPGSLAGTGGKLLFTVIAGSQGCGDEGGQVFSIVGKAKITKGTGKLLKAKGTLKFTGVYDRGAGTFSVKFKGSLTF
jgi:hypothetical protein